jgi:hypothetical protein
MKKLLLTITAVVATFAAAWTACHFIQRTDATFKELAEANEFSVQMEKYRTSASLPGKTRAESALWLQLGEQLSFRRRNNATFPSDALSIDAAYTYVRLSDLAKERNDQTAFLELLDDAIAICKQSSSPNCRAEALQKIVHVVDGKEKP